MPGLLLDIGGGYRSGYSLPTLIADSTALHQQKNYTGGFRRLALSEAKLAYKIFRTLKSIPSCQASKWLRPRRFILLTAGFMLIHALMTEHAQGPKRTSRLKPCFTSDFCEAMPWVHGGVRFACSIVDFQNGHQAKAISFWAVTAFSTLNLRLKNRGMNFLNTAGWLGASAACIIYGDTIKRIEVVADLAWKVITS